MYSITYYGYKVQDLYCGFIRFGTYITHFGNNTDYYTFW